MSIDIDNTEFKPAPLPSNEEVRLLAVNRTGAMYLEDDDLYNIYCYLAKEITGCSVSWTGLIDSKNQYCLASDGFPDNTDRSIPRKQTFCQYALSSSQPTIVENLNEHETFKNHPLVKQGIVTFYAAFPVITSDGYILGTLCVSDNRIVKLNEKQINLLKGLSTKLAYQLEIQEKFRNKTAESLLEILDKITDQIESLTIKDIRIILKCFSNQMLDTVEKKFLLDINIFEYKHNKFEITEFGNQLKKELSLEKGILKRVKNLSSNESDLNELFSQIK